MSENGVPPALVLVASGKVAVVVADESLVDSTEVVASLVLLAVLLSAVVDFALVAEEVSPVVASVVAPLVLSAVVEESSVVAVANVAVLRLGKSFCACTAVAASSARSVNARTSRMLRAMTVSQERPKRK